HQNRFYTDDQELIETPGDVVAEKFENITGIRERRYVSEDLDSSSIGLIAAQRAIEDSGIDPETIDQIIFAHNFGDVVKHTIQTDVQELQPGYSAGYSEFKVCRT
ncbi:hypothetical protein N9P66_05240, partial [Salibacteraceae bacterium]|nr:hypothetical protein [Salibacteraceae bacterium]